MSPPPETARFRFGLALFFVHLLAQPQYALDQNRCADAAPRALCADQRRTGQIHWVVAHRFIAGGRGGMNPQILSSPI
jgi:hypothetical protein